MVECAASQSSQLDIPLNAYSCGFQHIGKVNVSVPGHVPVPEQ